MVKIISGSNLRREFHLSQSSHFHSPRRPPGADPNIHISLNCVAQSFLLEHLIIVVLNYRCYYRTFVEYKTDILTLGVMPRCLHITQIL